MLSPNPAVKFTYEDYRHTPEDQRYELLDGELIMAPAPNLGHQRIDTRLGALLHTFVETRNLGEVFPRPLRRSAVKHRRGAAGFAVRLQRASTPAARRR